MKSIAEKNENQISLLKDDIAEINGDFNIVKENTLIRANYSLGLYEHRVMAVIASLMKPTDTKDTRYFFRVRDFADYFKLNSKDIYSSLQAVLVQLRQKTFILQRPNEVKRVTGWINWAEIIPSTGIVEVSVDERIRPYFLDVKKTLGYTKYQLKYVREFKCPYAYRLYEKFKEVLKGKKEDSLYMSFENIKEWLAIENQYQQFSDLRKRVLLPALEDINGPSKDIETKRKKVKNSSGSDIKVTMTEKRPGKKIIGVTFFIKANVSVNKEKHISTFESSPEVFEVLTEEHNKIITEFLEVGVNQVVIDQSIEKYGIDNLSYMYANFKKKKNAEDPAAYAAATLLNGYGIPRNEHEKNQAQKKNQIEKIMAEAEILTTENQAAATLTSETDEMIDKYLASLSPEEYKNVEIECEQYLADQNSNKKYFFRPYSDSPAQKEANKGILREYIRVKFQM